MSLFIGMLLPALSPLTPAETFSDQAMTSAETTPTVRSVSEITYTLPSFESERRIFTRAELARGRMMLVDETHPLPTDAPAPNTASIARTTNGTVPVRSLEVKTGWQTIAALTELFSQLRVRQANGLFVAQGAVTHAQQEQNYISAVRRLMCTYPPETAAAMVIQAMEAPGCSELLQEHTVELGSMQSQESAPEASPIGQLLLHWAWRFGFVRTSQQHPWRFRYVGKAHAAAMTYLDVDLPTYLEWLHQKRQLVVSDGEKPIYLILCVPLAGEYAAFDFPTGCSFEVSLDNTGYALAACIL